MRRILITLIVTVLSIAGAGAIASAAGGGSSVTRARLERVLPVVFSNQYVQQAALLGRVGLTPQSLDAKAMCDKHGPDVADVGPGSDWICLMGWTDPNVPMPPEGYGKFELAVHNNDCFTAGGPSKLVGFQTITDRDGRPAPNPVFEFDGCFDPKGDDTATGNSFPSVLNVASTVLQLLPDGTTGIQLTCGTGAQGCAGNVTAASGDTQLGSVPYVLQEEQASTLRIPTPVPSGAADVTFSFQPTTGIAPGSPSTIKIQA